MTLYIGSTPLSKAYIGSTEVKYIYVGNQEIWSNFGMVSMTKNGDQTLSSVTWTEVGPWTAVGGATVVGNSLRVNGAGNATIQVGSEWPTSGTSRNYRVLHNGVVVWTKGNTTGTTTFVDSFPLTVADGDLLRCEAYVNSGVVGNRIIKDGVNTYLRVVPVV